MRAWGLVCVALALGFVAAGCGKRHRGPPPPPPPPYQRVVIAVLPLDNASLNMDAPGILRLDVWQRLGQKGYLVQPLGDSDERLRRAGVTLAGQLASMQTPELKLKLGVDRVVMGKVVNHQSLITGIYNRRTFEAELQMIDLDTGAELWRDRRSITTDDENFKANTGLEVLSGVAKGVQKSDMRKESGILAQAFINSLPWCPRQPPPPPPAAPPAAPSP